MHHDPGRMAVVEVEQVSVDAGDRRGRRDRLLHRGHSRAAGDRAAGENRSERVEAPRARPDQHVERDRPVRGELHLARVRHAGHHAGSAPPKPSPRPARHSAPPPPPPVVAGPHESGVPILMYHVLGVPSASAPYPDLYVKPSDLAGQMQWLASRGYHAVTLGQVFRYWHSGIALPAKPIVVSFDDGYLSDYTVAMPTLRRHGWPGVLSLIVDNVRPGDLTALQVRRLI